ncbi:MAG: hypothetical protein RL670_1085 [Actinomycetota bacterium]
MTPQNLPALLGPIYLAAVAWPLTRIDLRERRLPNRLVLPALAITLFGQLLAVLCSAPASKLLVALACATCAFIGGLLLNRFAGLGMGDVKLIAAITFALAWFSPFAPLVALTAGLVAATVSVLVMLLLRKTSMGQSIALGPYLLVGFLFSLIGLGWS